MISPWYQLLVSGAPPLPPWLLSCSTTILHKVGTIWRRRNKYVGFDLGNKPGYGANPVPGGGLKEIHITGKSDNSFVLFMLYHRFSKITDRTLDVVFSRFGWNSLTITLRQKPRGVSHNWHKCRLSLSCNSSVIVTSFIQILKRRHLVS